MPLAPDPFQETSSMWQRLSLLRRNRKEAFEASVDLQHAAILEERSVAVLKDVTATANEKLTLLKLIFNTTVKHLQQW
jgi:hypothetical protein